MLFLSLHRWTAQAVSIASKKHMGCELSKFVPNILRHQVYMLLCIKGGVCDAHMSRRNFNRNLLHSDVRNKRRRPKKKAGRMQVYGSAITQLKADVSSILRVLNVEEKHNDVINSAVAMTGNWQIALMNGLTTGTSAVTRIGQSVKCSGIECRFYGTLNAAATVPEIVRLVIFIDKECDTTAPTPLNIFTNSVISPRVDGYMDQYRVLYDSVFVMSPTGTETWVSDFIANQQWHVSYNTGNAGTIADIVTNSLYFMFVSNAAANFSTINYNLRFIYIDN